MKSIFLPNEMIFRPGLQKAGAVNNFDEVVNQENNNLTKTEIVPYHSIR